MELSVEEEPYADEEPLEPLEPSPSSLAGDHAHALDLALDLDLDLDPKLKRKLQEIKDQLPDVSRNNGENFKQWWQENGQAWTEQLRAVMIQHRNIGHDWQFSNEQKQLLKQYYDANKLLIDCLNSDCYISRDVRQEIEDTLLLPMSETVRDRTSPT